MHMNFPFKKHQVQGYLITQVIIRTDNQRRCPFSNVIYIYSKITEYLTWKQT